MKCVKGGLLIIPSAVAGAVPACLPPPAKKRDTDGGVRVTV